MKIVLVQPPVEDFYFTPHRSSVLGLHALADVWTKRGHNCQILNFPLEKPKKKKIPLPEKLEYLIPYLKKQDNETKNTSWFSNYYRFGPPLEICCERIIALEPRVIAISCFAWGYAQTTLRLLKMLRDGFHTNPPLLVVGGAGASVMPDFFTPFADLVIMGEGENAIEEIEKTVAIKRNIISGSKITMDSPMDIPFPWDIKDKKKNRFTVTTMLSRGCPKMCSFCANHLVFGKTLRKVDIKTVFAGIDNILDYVLKTSKPLDLKTDRSGEHEYKIKLHVNFEDDNILFQKKYFLTVLKYLKVKCDQNMIDFSFSAENGMDYLLLNDDLLVELKNLNLTQLNLSMASMDSGQLELEKREGSIKKLEVLLKKSEQLGLPVITYFICGLKNDTPVKIVETLAYLHSLKTSIGISHYYPVPGLADWQDRNVFLENPPFLCCGSSAYPWNGSLNTRELITAFRLARASNYIKDSLCNKGMVLKIKTNLLKDATMDEVMVNLFFILVDPND